MIKILFVCLGNICRSPTAEGMFRQHLNKAGIRDGYLHNIYIDSAGTGSWHVGKAPDSRSQRTAKKHGLDLSDLRARQVTLQDFVDYDYILAMDKENLNNLKAMAPKNSKAKLELFMNYSENCPGITEVPDPYSGRDDGFERVFNIISRGSEGLLKYIQQKYTL